MLPVRANPNPNPNPSPNLNPHPHHHRDLSGRMGARSVSDHLLQLRASAISATDESGNGVPTGEREVREWVGE